MGHLSQARELHEAALALKREWFPSGHAEIGYSLNNLAWVVRAEGDYDQAIELYEAALANFSNALGENHLNVSVVRGNLATTLLESGDADRALDLYRQSLNGIAAMAGERSSYALPVHVGMGRCYEQLGRPDLALENYRTAVSIGDEINPRAWDIGMALGLMAALPDVSLSDAERTAAFERSLSIFADTSGSRTSDRAQVMVKFARHLQAVGEIEAGRTMFGEALAIERESLPPDHPRLISHLREFEERFASSDAR
jgi:tetratricopeptide (TPR) repeat protein